MSYDSEPRGFHRRGYLPHLDMGASPQFITFRLGDSLPAHVLGQFYAEIASLSDSARRARLEELVERHLASGAGSCVLRRPDVAEIVENALLHFDGSRYQLDAWCVMPNHVHVLVTPSPGRSVGAIVQSWKGFTAREINRLLGSSGPLWQPDYFDTLMETDEGVERTATYIELNPVVAGLCERPEDWRFSSARRRV